MKHVNAVIVPSSRCAALPSLRRKDGGADIRVALLEAGFQEGDLVSIGMETIPPDEQLEQARAAAKANGEEVTRLTLENARLEEERDAARGASEKSRFLAADKQEELATAVALNTRLTEVIHDVEHAVLADGLTATTGPDGEWFCRKCGAHAKALRAVQHRADCVVGSVSAAILAVLDASDNAPFRQPGGAA